LRALFHQYKPSLTNLSQLPLAVLYGFVYLLPLCYVIFFLHYRRPSDNPDAPWNELMLVTAAGVSLLLSVCYARLFGRMAEVSLPALILFIWLLSQSPRSQRRLLAVAWAAALVLAIFPPSHAQFGWHGVLNAPGRHGRLLAPQRLPDRSLAARPHPSRRQVL
jgi:hypothetical protein